MEEPCPGRGRQLLRLVGGEEKDTGKKRHCGREHNFSIIVNKESLKSKLKSKEGLCLLNSN